MTTTSTRSLRPVAPATAPAPAPDASRTTRRRSHKPGARAAIVAGGAALIIGILLATFSAVGTRDDAGTLSEQVLTACATGGQAAAELQALGACPLAAAVQADTQDPLLIDTGLSASQTAEVVGLVRAELDANPPRDGRTPGAAAVQAAVRAVAAADPLLLRGPAGPPVPEAQVRAIAAAVIAADPEAFRGERGDDGEQGDMGEPGQPGRGIIASEQDPDDPCVRIVRYDQPPLEERWRTCADPEPAPAQDPPPTPTTTPPPAPAAGGMSGLFG